MKFKFQRALPCTLSAGRPMCSRHTWTQPSHSNHPNPPKGGSFRASVDQDQKSNKLAFFKKMYKFKLSYLSWTLLPVITDSLQVLTNMTSMDFPGGTVVKNPPANAGDTRAATKTKHSQKKKTRIF